MNDRFKFRVWDKNHNTYIPSRMISTLLYFGYKDEFHIEFECFSTFADSLIIEQCTGFSDKNGNLIYEGAIVSGRLFNPYHPKTPNPEIKGVVRFIQDRMTWVIETGDEGYDFEDCIPECFEIIGNIHEQAEQKDK